MHLRAADSGESGAAVMPMASFPEDAVMQAIAAENNLAETAFLVGYSVRADGVREDGVREDGDIGFAGLRR